jgi:hypothetical protein
MVAGLINRLPGVRPTLWLYSDVEQLYLLRRELATYGVGLID